VVREKASTEYRDGVGVVDELCDGVGRAAAGEPQARSRRTPRAMSGMVPLPQGPGLPNSALEVLQKCAGLLDREVWCEKEQVTIARD
jgi:hypothetical protein